MKILSSIFVLLLASFCAHAQLADPSINILAQPATVVINNNAVLSAQIINAGSRDIIANTLSVTISVGTNVEIIGFTNGTDANFTIQSLTTGANNTIKLVNSALIPQANGFEVLLNVKGLTESAAQTITGNVVYIAGNDPLLGGAPNSVQGNSSNSNDNSTTSLAVRSTPLPVKLISFTGKVNNCEAQLAWKTASETSFDRFDLQSSKDGMEYLTIGTLKGAKNSGGGSDYAFSVAQPNGAMLYRLKMLDLNGDFSYSANVSLKTDCNNAAINVFPNPSEGSAYVSGLDANDEVTVFDFTGKIVERFTAKNRTEIIHLSGKASGIYNVLISKGGNNTTRSIVKK